MTPKQTKFVQEYLVDLNATQAAIRAGYSKTGASVEGTRLLANANIGNAIAEKQKKVTEKTGLTIQKVLDDIEMIKGLALGDGDSKTALKAIELMGKHLGAFTDRIQHSGPDGGAIQTELVVNFVKPKGIE